jgi:hypothetical protein
MRNRHLQSHVVLLLVSIPSNWSALYTTQVAKECAAAQEMAQPQLVGRNRAKRTFFVITKLVPKDC